MADGHGSKHGDWKDAVAQLRSELNTTIKLTEDHVLTAIFGFVNGASARMEALEKEAARNSSRIRMLEERLQVLEKAHSPT